MEADDPRTPLLGNNRDAPSARFRRCAAKLCSVQSWRRRLPVTIWLPKYKLVYLPRDMIAGVTVGLTSIPQGIAYAILAGLPPQVGLYSSIFPGIVYALFGSCKDVTVGPTAILAALVAKTVAKSDDFAYLASFLSGCIIMALGALQLGFLLDFISKPVISGFTTAAALQIGASQLKSLFRTSGSSGDTFIKAVINFFKNIRTVQLWDTLLGVTTIIALMLIKRANFALDTGASRAQPQTQTQTQRTQCRARCARAWQHVVRARNALVVSVGALLAYALHLRGLTPFALIGKIEGGLPEFGPPPFSTTVGNHTLSFGEMLAEFGPEGLVMPLVAILESIAIAKAFAGSAPVDATQEMIAIGACNVLSSFAQSMPATGSFTRTALNNASGVLTPAGSIFKACLVVLAVTLLTEAFFFIPRATLAAVILVAMASIVEPTFVARLWRNSRPELCVWAVTVCAGSCAGLEYGIAAGALGDAARALAASARPAAHGDTCQVGNEEFLCIRFAGRLGYASAEHVSRRVRGLLGARHAAAAVVLDGRHLHHVDIGVAENLIAVIRDMEKEHRFLLWNFSPQHQALFEDLQTGFGERFVSGPSIDQHILGFDVERRNV